MAMQALLYSVNGLATELRVDRRTVAKKLQDVPPAGKRNGHPVWRLADALPVLTRAKRGADRDAPPPPPPGFEFVARLAPHDALTAMALLTLAYRLPPVLATTAVASGAPCKVAYAMSEAGKMVALQLVAEVAADHLVRPWADQDDPAVAAPDLFEAVNWPALAEAAGEPVDLATWSDWTRERFA